MKTPRTTQNPGTIRRSQISPSREEEAYFHRNCKTLHLALSRLSDTALGAPELTGGGGKGRKGTAKAPGAAPGLCQGPSGAEPRQQRALSAPERPAQRPTAPSGAPGQGRGTHSHRPYRSQARPARAGGQRRPCVPPSRPSAARCGDPAGGKR